MSVGNMGALVWRAAVHEAGHVVADYKHGFCPIEAEVKPDGSGRTDCRDRQAVAATVENFAVSCFAGCEAEREIVGTDDFTEVGASTDLHKAESVLPGCLDLAVYRSRARALVLDDNNHRAILRIATELAARRILVGKELRLVIEAAFGLERAEERLSAFRTGEEELVLGVLRSQQGPLTFLATAVYDALVFGDLRRLKMVTPLVCVRKVMTIFGELLRWGDGEALLLSCLTGVGAACRLRA